MLLCQGCKRTWREWMSDSSKYYEKRDHAPHAGPPSRIELERYSLIPLANWCEAYWRNKIAKENGRLPLSGGQVPPSPEARQASPAPQGLC
jgi:hypothetical protein